MSERRDPVPADVRRLALTLLASGKVSLPEMAEVMGVSTQSIWNWCRHAKVDWRKARRATVAREWARISK